MCFGDIANNKIRLPTLQAHGGRTTSRTKPWRNKAVRKIGWDRFEARHRTEGFNQTVHICTIICLKFVIIYVGVLRLLYA